MWLLKLTQNCHTTPYKDQYAGGSHSAQTHFKLVNIYPLAPDKLQEQKGFIKVQF